MSRSPGIASAPNLRDVGGYLTVNGGGVRLGVLFRSTALNRLEGDDAVAFSQLGIRAVYDLRTLAERAAEPDRLPPDTDYFVADVIGDETVGSPAHMSEMLTSPEAAREHLGDGRGYAMWTRHYRDFVLLDSARAAYGRLYSDLAIDAHRPALIHCSTGKDRTGWAAAAVLLFLGVPYEAVLEDFLLSNAYLQPLFRPLIEQFAARGGDPELLRPITSVVAAYLDAALDEVRHSFGGIEGYFADGLGINAVTRQALREAFLDEG